MKRPVRVLRRAQADLLEIQAYIARDRPEAAKALVNTILDLLQAIASSKTRMSIAAIPPIGKILST